jgi:hypothetical protein
MLVFYKYPYGSTIIDGQRIYGYLEKYPPARVSWDVFRNTPNLMEASYTPQRLKMLFPSAEFPNVSFMYSDLRYLEWEDMCALCKAFNITTGRSNSERRKALRTFLKEKC